MNNELFYQLALSFIPQIGRVQARILVEKFGDAAAVFRAGRAELESIEGIGAIRAGSIKRFNDFKPVEKELRFIEKYKIQPLFLTDPAYPRRLLECYDPPTLLYFKGNADLNARRVLAIVGTRTCSAYGKGLTEELLAGIRDLTGPDTLIVSGLAFGIDALAHRNALKHGLPTIGVLAHGLHTLYPKEHHSLARGMLETGGLLTEFNSGCEADKHNFPTRNRIVAGMADATVVIETGLKGGSLITAGLANDYNRDVFAYPGRTTDPGSAGCNRLIYSNKAMLLTCAARLVEAMGWEKDPAAAREARKAQQAELFKTFTQEEKDILGILQIKETAHIDEISSLCRLPFSKIASAVLNLELQGTIRALPGKIFCLA